MNTACKGPTNVLAGMSIAPNEDLKVDKSVQEINTREGEGRSPWQ
jgi:hypothetical protein